MQPSSLLKNWLAHIIRLSYEAVIVNMQQTNGEHEEIGEANTSPHEECMQIHEGYRGLSSDATVPPAYILFFVYLMITKF